MIETLERRMLLTAVRFVDQGSLIDFGTEGRVSAALSADFDGDQQDEILVVGAEQGQPLGIHRISRDGDSFEATEVGSVAAEWLFNLQPTDIDADGDLDAVGTARDGERQRLVWLKNDGEQWSLQDVPEGQGTRLSQVLDVNGDGFVDLVGRRGSELLIYPVQGDGVGNPFTVIELTDELYNYRLQDVNADGLADLVYVSRSEGFGVRINEGDVWGEFAILIPAEANPGGGLGIRDLDADGDVDIALGRHRLLNDGNGDFEFQDGEYEFWRWGGSVLDQDDVPYVIGYDFFGPAEVFEFSPVNLGYQSVAVLPASTVWGWSDLDGDGDFDILAGSDFGNSVGWMANAPNVDFNLKGPQQINSGAVANYQLSLSNNSRSELVGVVTGNDRMAALAAEAEWSCIALGNAVCPTNPNPLDSAITLAADGQLAFEFAGSFSGTTLGAQELAASFSIDGLGRPLQANLTTYIRPADFGDQSVGAIRADACDS